MLSIYLIVLNDYSFLSFPIVGNLKMLDDVIESIYMFKFYSCSSFHNYLRARIKS